MLYGWVFKNKNTGRQFYRKKGLSHTVDRYCAKKYSLLHHWGLNLGTHKAPFFLQSPLGSEWSVGMSRVYLMWFPEAQEINLLNTVSLIVKWRKKFLFTSVLIQASALICLPWCTVATIQIFLNIDEIPFFFFFFAPTVPFILGRLGIPIFGNRATPSWLWHRPNDHFSCFLLRQKMSYLFMDIASLAQSQVHWSKRGLDCALCSLPL